MSNYSSSTKPGGNNTEVQYNKNGKFEGDSNLTWDEGNTRLEVLNGKIRLRSTTDDDQIELDVLNRKILLREGGIYNNEIRYSGGAITIDSNSISMLGQVQFGFPLRIVSSGLTYADLQFTTLSNNMAAIEAWRDGNDYNAHLILQNIAYNVGIGPFNPATPAAKLHVIPHNSAERVSIFQGTTGQTANLTEWRDDTGTAHATVNADGEFTNTGGQANSEVFGANATVSGQNSTAIGNGATASISGTAIGTNASANGTQSSTAIGYNSSADGQNATAIGFSTSADFLASVAIGYLANCNGTNGVSIGRSATSSTAESTAIGALSNAAAYSTCIGNNATAVGTSAVVIGRNAAGTSTEATAIGARSTAGFFATSLGARAGEGGTGARSSNFGYNTKTSQDSIALGYQASAVGNKNNIAIGNNCTVTSEEGIGIGHNISAGGLSVVIGSGASGSNAVGCRSTAATASSAFGFNARAVNRDATAIGYSTYAGRQCVALGNDAYALGSGEQPAMALGRSANVNNYLSSAVGPGCVATASYQFVGGGTGTYTKRTKVYFGNGVTNAAPESFTLYGTSATAGSNANGGNVAIQAGSGDGTGTNGLIILNNLPTSDPGVTGALWNDSGTLKVS